jgi:hypothetical protein
MLIHCPTCHSSGVCPTCHGSKAMPRAGRWLRAVDEDDIIPCATCFGIGECPVCRGGRIEPPNEPFVSQFAPSR